MSFGFLEFLILDPELTEQLDEIAVPVLADVPGKNVTKLIRGLYVTDDDYSLLRQLLNKNMPQSNVLDSRAVGSISCDVQRRGVVNIQ